jgi:hypothetical protein
MTTDPRITHEEALSDVENRVARARAAIAPFASALTPSELEFAARAAVSALSAKPLDGSAKAPIAAEMQNAAWRALAERGVRNLSAADVAAALDAAHAAGPDAVLPAPGTSQRSTAKPLDGDAVERVAAAAFVASKWSGESWDEQSEVQKDQFRDMAGAALAAMPKDGRALELAPIPEGEEVWLLREVETGALLSAVYRTEAEAHANKPSGFEPVRGLAGPLLGGEVAR